MKLSGLYSEKDDDHTNNTVPHEQDHYMSEKHMVHEFGNDSILSTSSRNSDDDDDEEITSHPDYYTAAQKTTSPMASDCSNEVGQCSDHCNSIKQESLVSEDGGVTGVADDD